MKSAAIIQKAKTEGKNSLTEAEAKEILKEYGIPVVDEKCFVNIEDTETAADQMGYPVVLKGLGANLTHKTERGLVQLNLKNRDEVRRAAEIIKERAGADLEGFILQPQIEGKREFVAGLFQDMHFGATIMFGLGGIYTEALGDVVFRLAPLSAKEAGAMIDEVHSQKLLNNFRGEKAPDKGSLINVLLGLSRISQEIPAIKEIDVNPLLVSPDGRIRAVDALIVLGDNGTSEPAIAPVAPKVIAKLFYPQSVAFVGASAKYGKWGHLIYTNVASGKYAGKMYLVNSQGGKIAGREVFKSVKDIPGPVDLAVVMVPAHKVIALIPELKEKKIKNMLLVTSGFSETGDEGKLLEKKLVEKARSAGIVILGPNTMGISNPHISFHCLHAPVRPIAGSTAFVAQSGNLGAQLLAFAEKEGIGIRAFCGSGNEAMLTIEDYLEGFAVDKITKTVVLYIESVKEGKRFFKAASRVGKIKPVIVLKGGRTQAGSQAAASHTGAMASDIKVFNAASRQAGIILAESPMDLLDLSATFSSLPLPRGNKVGIMTMGGGWGVVTCDLCIENGLSVPELPPELIARINPLLPPFWSHANPIDLVATRDREIHNIILEELLKWPGCDAVIHMGMVGALSIARRRLEAALAADENYDEKFMSDSLKLVAQAEKQFIEKSVYLMGKYQKPVVGVTIATDDTLRTVTDVKDSIYKAVAFVTPEKAVKSLARMFKYAQWLKG